MKTFIISLIVLLPALAWCQTGNLEGIVFNEEGDTLAYTIVVVYAEATAYKGVRTDINGKFRIDDLPVGKYVVEVRYLGNTKMINDVYINSNMLRSLIIVMDKSSPVLEYVGLPSHYVASFPMGISSGAIWTGQEIRRSAVGQ